MGSGPPNTAKFPEIYRFVYKKKVITSGLHALSHILGNAVARLMFIVHDWLICTPDFSCCMDEII